MGIFDLNCIDNVYHRIYNVTKRIIQLVKTDLLEVKDESSLNFADVSYDGQFHLFLGNGSVKILLTSS